MSAHKRGVRAHPVTLAGVVLLVAGAIALLGFALSPAVPDTTHVIVTPVPRAPAPAPASVSASPLATRTHVTSVHDGDTFTITTGDKVRVLVMDSCEIGTGGGARARDEAKALLSGKDVTLTRDGPSRDRYGRLLRRVTLPDGRDFADVMLEADHTALYAGHQDASPAAVAEGKAHDANGRRC